MPRTYQALNASPEELKRRIASQFENAALGALRENMLAILNEHQLAIESGALPAYGAVESLLTHYESLLPPRPGDRFILDSWIIQNLSESWSYGTVKLPRTILPLYGAEWMWQCLPWIAQPDRTGHRIYGITLKGRDHLSSVHLLEYPWLCHELGHGLFVKAPRAFLDEFVQIVEDYCRPIIRKGLADSPEVRALTRGHAERIRQRWLPRGDQQSWVHELAVDIFALWSCGPAFLAAMADAADSSQIEPFLFESFHPPYALRVKMLCICAKQLGWENEARSLVELGKRWESREAAKANHNQFVSATPQQLSDQVLRWALDACRMWKIPRCNRDTLRVIAERRQNKLAIDSAVELIVSAWLIFEKDRHAYPEWESLAVHSLFAELNGDS